MTNSALPKTSSLSTPLDLQLRFRLAVEADLPKLEWMGQYIQFRRVFRYTFEEQQRGNRLMLVADVNNYPVGQIFMILRNVDEWNEERGYFYSLRVMDPFDRMGFSFETEDERQIVESERSFGARAMFLQFSYSWGQQPQIRTRPQDQQQGQQPDAGVGGIQ